MSLAPYNEKRNFKQTAEPAGKSGKSEKGLIFVVQKHDASRLHYDFRLELDGTLKSWAVPKGPSLNPADKRLAMVVEDHPYNYKDFEGTIPEGNYGAGNVIVWDKGIYTAVETITPKEEKEKLLEGLKAGHLSFILHGNKLNGEFSLVKLKGTDKNPWLLIKKDDEYASTVDILEADKSVISGVPLKPRERKTAAKPATVKKKAGQPETGIANAVEVAFVKPMLADNTITTAFDKEGWVFETKYDGYRTVAVIKQLKVNLFSRNELSFNNKFQTVAQELKAITHDVVLDGEVVIEDSKGRSDFQLLQNHYRTGEGKLKYYVFDIMNLDGQSLVSLSLLERKELLKLLLAKYKFNNIFYSEHTETKGKALLETAKKQNWEGIMAKDGQSPYRVGKRSSQWFKIKLSQEEEAIIVGFTSPKGSRSHFGALLLAQYDSKTLKYIGNCGTGFTESVLKELFAKFQPYYTDTSPLTEEVKLPGEFQWVKPVLVCQVKFTERTQEGHLRHPVYMGLRKDKKAKEVTIPAQAKNSNTMKTPQESKKTVADDYDLKVGKTTLHLTNQNKIYFPADGITKGDIVQYYNAVADTILPYLKNRPQSMNRFPNGIKGPNFYQKDVDVDKIPDWLKTVKVHSESNDENIDYLLCNDKATLLYMANLGCIDINPWNSTVNQLEQPDWAVIDLDPEKEDFKEVVKVALAVKQLLDELDAPCYCKTSGASGLHIYIPLATKYTYDTVKLFAEMIANTVADRLPETATIIRTIKKRNHKLYIDFLQNRHGQTLAAPYSVRPQPGATVSTPLEWSEVNDSLSPSQFTIKNVPQRIATKGDLWKPVLGKGVDIEKLIGKMEGRE